MITQFKTLFVPYGLRMPITVGVAEDIGFVLPSDTAAAAAKRRSFLAKERDGKLYVLCETDEEGAAIAQAGDEDVAAWSKSYQPVVRKLHCGSRPEFTGARLLFRNKPIATALDRR